LVFWRNPERTAREIEAFSARDAHAYREFAALLHSVVGVAIPMMRSDLRRPSGRELLKAVVAAGRGRRHLGDMVTLATSSAAQIVDERFEHPIVRSALLNLAAGGGSIVAEGSGVLFLLLGLLHDYGVSRPVGGIQALVNALAASIESSGGTIRTNSAVRQILVTGDRARGVELADGTVITADVVLSTADPHTTLSGLLPEGTLDKALTSRVEHIPANAGGVSQFKIDLALSGQLSVPNHHRSDVDLRQPVLLWGTEDDVLDSFAVSSRGVVPDRTFLWACITNAVDPSQAPAGQDSVYLYPPAMPVAPTGGWGQHSATVEKLALATASRFLGGLEELEIGRWVEDPEQMARRTRARNGCVVHVDFTPFRLGPLRPARGLANYRTPVPGLYMGGSGVHPGGWVSGLPGALSARRVLRDTR
jgi:phytoene dehydrogenase-like protein